VELNVAADGDGPTIMLVHGFPHTWRIWSELIGPLAARYRVLAPDLRGFGDSTPTADGLDAQTLSQDLEGLLDRPATVVAIDAGVPVAFLLALRRPDLVDARRGELPPGPLHRVALARLGMPLIDVADPTELAAACVEEGRATFLFVAAPPRLGAASGVPVNPLAIF
jgi:pimeloyl-ACP methyl ester carboxylesterase